MKFSDSFFKRKLIPQNSSAQKIYTISKSNQTFIIPGVFGRSVQRVAGPILAPGQCSSEETSQRWRAVGNTVLLDRLVKRTQALPRR